MKFKKNSDKASSGKGLMRVRGREELNYRNT